VPYGIVDVDRLLASLTMVQAGPLGGRTLGVQEKGVSALESLLFAKYQMYRNVYWHHAVRSATCMFKRAVREAVAAGALNPAEVSDATDDVVMEQLTRNGSELARAVRGRQRELETVRNSLQAIVNGDARHGVSFFRFG